MASTTLNIGNAIGLAVFTVLADLGTGGRTGEALRAATADGGTAPPPPRGPWPPVDRHRPARAGRA